MQAPFPLKNAQGRELPPPAGRPRGFYALVPARVEYPFMNAHDLIAALTGMAAIITAITHLIREIRKK